ncbi:hypothetical protein CHGG_04103 [Chaetomium globosum CBS 148.51]|uniref:LysM domain-containing protein n=1 Tax=Chaetomium globosum (strain ATCC 6205 / CBS 148.51 / DSM 1962 / NBRC 6347 / NRRL 1970) TaxID=306901 RepID=Q2H293_CHAGB|nr:uncharacterized protein CHGG_04103 [Chaetomium globosum CBS 148.51]EAQ87484.1 hypothetical protein CHGG_04103 [Chaetomium globosum CBS 148.51]
MVAIFLTKSFLLLALGFSQQVIAECTQSITAKQGDTCASISSQVGITVTDFLRSNPSVTSCSLVAGQSYCVKGTADSGTPPQTSTPAGLVIRRLLFGPRLLRQHQRLLRRRLSGRVWKLRFRLRRAVPVSRRLPSPSRSPASQTSVITFHRHPKRAPPATVTQTQTSTVTQPRATTTTTVTRTLGGGGTVTTTVSVPATITSVVRLTTVVTSVRTSVSVSTSVSTRTVTVTSLVVDTITSIETSTRLVTSGVCATKTTTGKPTTTAPPEGRPTLPGTPMHWYILGYGGR